MSADIIPLGHGRRAGDIDSWKCLACGNPDMRLDWCGPVICASCGEKQPTVAWMAASVDEDEIARAMRDHNLRFVDAVYFVHKAGMSSWPWPPPKPGMILMMPNHLATLTERRDYLSGRAELKAGLGWEHEYDERERDALAWAIKKLRGEGEEDGA